MARGWSKLVRRRCERVGGAADALAGPAQSPLERVGALGAFGEAAAQRFGAAPQFAEAAGESFGAAAQGLPRPPLRPCGFGGEAGGAAAAGACRRQ